MVVTPLKTYDTQYINNYFTYLTYLEFEDFTH
jgi:hypothetical protein